MIHALSNIEAILLSIVNEKPSYAYEIDKIIDSRELRTWAKIGVASIYQVLKRLEQKKMVISKIEKEGRMPDRKRYYITKFGKTALVENAKQLISSFEWYYFNLNVGLEISDLLTNEELVTCAKKRLAVVQSNAKVLKKKFTFGNEKSFKKKAVIKNLLLFREAEETFLQQFIQELKPDRSPDTDGVIFGFLRGESNE